MKAFTKRAGLFTAVIALLLTLAAGVCLISGGSAATANAETQTYKHFYSQLSNDPVAKNVYDAFEKLYEDGSFKKGTVQYELVSNDVVPETEIEMYVSGGSDRFPKSFGAGRDTFYMDHPDLFYIDLFDLSISAGQDKSGKYVAYLDSSRVLSTYKGNLNSEAKINKAIEAYEAKLSEIVTEAEKKATVTEKIEYVNDYLKEHNNYGFGTTVKNGRNVDTDNAPFIYSAYGALVNNESVCEGYAKAFKAVMDRLGIPCTVVSGYANGKGVSDSDNSMYEPHMWNCVRVDGQWYMVDPTYNATSSQNKWMLCGGQQITGTHIEEKEVSTSGYELRYPALKPYEYGNNTDDNGMVIEGHYTETEEIGRVLELVISVDGKGARKLREDGKYLAYRFGTDDEYSNTEWSEWIDIIAFNEAMEFQFDLEGGEWYPITDYDTTMQLSYGIEYVQLAVLNRAPDKDVVLLAMEYKAAYNPDTLTDADFCGAISAPYKNDGYGSHVIAPYPEKISPNSAILKVDDTYEMKFVYSESLSLAAGKKLSDVSMDVTASRSSETIMENVEIKNLKWDGDKTITFTFTPSKMYVHNRALYYFTPSSLVGKNSGKVPCFASYMFEGTTIVCNKILSDGRLYMKLYGEPKILDDSDLSVTDFQDENGNYFAASQRSQLLLVANKTTPAQKEQMDGLLETEMGVKQEDIVSSSTYEINLQLCGVVPKIPNGSYMHLMFGFPEGYDPDDAGTTFKIYHYKTDSKGNILGVEEIPVIINEYGIVAKVDSFSPFAIVQLKNTSAAVTGNSSVYIYASVNGSRGGTVKTGGKSGICEVTGDSITYDIKADKGFSIGKVTLDGKALDASVYKDGKLTLAKSDLSTSNMLEVYFVNTKMAKSYASKGMAFYNYSTAEDPSKTGVIIGIVVVVLVLAAAGFTAWWFLAKSEKQPAAETAGASAQKATTAKPNATAKPTTAARPTTTAATTKPTTATKPTTTATAKPTATRPAASAKPTATTTTKPATNTTATKPAASTQARPTPTARPAARPASTATRPASRTTPPRKDR